MTARYEFALKGRRHLAKPYHFKAAGLPNVYLLSGVKIERDLGYAEVVTVDRLPGLIWTIAFTLVRKPAPLLQRRLPPRSVIPAKAGTQVTSQQGHCMLSAPSALVPPTAHAHC